MGEENEGKKGGRQERNEEEKEKEIMGVSDEFLSILGLVFIMHTLKRSLQKNNHLRYNLVEELN